MSGCAAMTIAGARRKSPNHRDWRAVREGLAGGRSGRYRLYTIDRAAP